MKIMFIALLMTASLSSFAQSEPSATSNPEPAPTPVARTVADAIAGKFTGEVLTKNQTLHLTIDGRSYAYKLGKGICFGAVTSGGCFYDPADPDGAPVSVTYKCAPEGGLLKTVQISTLSLYGYSASPLCEKLAH